MALRPSWRLREGLGRAAMAAATILLAAPALSGCGSVYYAVTSGAAQARLEEARQLGAESRAPYEYYAAEVHLDEAAREAADASYSDAASYAELAEQYAQKAIEIAKGLVRGTGDGEKRDGKSDKSDKSDEDKSDGAKKRDGKASEDDR